MLRSFDIQQNIFSRQHNLVRRISDRGGQTTSRRAFFFDSFHESRRNARKGVGLFFFIQKKGLKVRANPSRERAL
jgi:hypothetical protein